MTEHEMMNWTFHTHTQKQTKKQQRMYRLSVQHKSVDLVSKNIHSKIPAAATGMEVLKLLLMLLVLTQRKKKGSTFFIILVLQQLNKNKQNNKKKQKKTFFFF